MGQHSKDSTQPFNGANSVEGRLTNHHRENPTGSYNSKEATSGASSLELIRFGAFMYH